MPKPENLIPHQIKPGEVRNPNGRPRKYVSTLKAQGYKLAEINDCIQVMMAMTIEELKDAFENPNATVLEKTIAAAIKRSIEKGSLYSIETLLSRVYGKPKESVDMDLQGEVTITMNLNNDKRKDG